MKRCIALPYFLHACERLTLANKNLCLVRVSFIIAPTNEWMTFHQWVITQVLQMHRYFWRSISFHSQGTMVTIVIWALKVLCTLKKTNTEQDCNQKSSYTESATFYFFRVKTIWLFNSMQQNHPNHSRMIHYFQIITLFPSYSRHLVKLYFFISQYIAEHRNEITTSAFSNIMQP